MSKVSIIVPIYNVEQYIAKCLDSLISQTFSDIEILAISDGSPDNSDLIVKKYAKKDKRIKFIRKENGGYASVIEYALNTMDSKYFMICDPDDWLEDNAVEILYKTITKNKADLVVGGRYIVHNGEKEIVYSDSKIRACERQPIENEVSSNTHDFFYLDPSPHSKLFKTSTVKEFKAPHGISFTDMLLYIYSLENIKKVVYIKDAVSYYYIDRPGNTITTFKDKTFYDHQLVIKKLLDYAELYNDKSLYARIYIHFRYALSEMNKYANHTAKVKYFNEYWQIFKELINHKNDVIDNYPNKDSISIMKCKFILSGMFQKAILNMLMRTNNG